MKNFKKNLQCKRELFIGMMLVTVFVIWTVLVQTVDVHPVGLNGTDVGFATFNTRFHQLTGVHMAAYIITDWLSLIPVFVCVAFAVIGLVQLIKRKRLLKVDCDIIFLGVYYIVVILCYLAFEMIPINYRPIFIDGIMETSYPSSTTLLVLGVMPTLVFRIGKRVKNTAVKKIVSIFTGIFTVFMVIGRLVSGVHWFTDIVGAVLLSTGLYYLYKAAILLCNNGSPSMNCYCTKCIKDA